MPQIILASASAGRKKVLESLGIKFKVIPAEIDERKITASSPFLLVKKLARLKAEKVFSLARRPLTRLKVSKSIIIAADSLAIIEEKRIKDQKMRKKLAKHRLGNYYVLGKPTTKSETITFLTTLSNNIHYFLTGLYIINTKDKAIYQSVTKTKLWFNKLTEEQIKDYVKSQPVLTYAGAIK